MTLLKSTDAGTQWKEISAIMNNELYLYLKKMDRYPFSKIKFGIIFFKELSLTRKENILRNSKQTRKKKYKKHLEKTILNTAETLHNVFLPDRFLLSRIKESYK